MSNTSDNLQNNEVNEKNTFEEEEGNTIEYMVKLLLSCQIAWSISRRNEAKVTWMLEKFGSDVRLSKNDDFYPGTAERVCLISGSVKQITSTLEWIFNAKNDDIRQQIQILVPKTSLSNLIHRGGVGLKTLCERENVDLQLPEANNNNVMREVCTTITGKKQNIIRTCLSIAKIIKKDPFYGICKNVSYEEFNTFIKWKEQQNNIVKHLNVRRMMPQQQQQLQPVLLPMNHQNPWAQPTNIQHQSQQHQSQQQIYNNYQQTQYSQQYGQQQQHPQAISTLLLQQTQPLIQMLPQQILQQQLHQQQQQQQQQQHQQQQQQPQTHKETKEESPQKENNNNNKTPTKKVNEEDNQIGNPIPSLTSFWRSASDKWTNNGNSQREWNNAQNDVIPGFN